MLGGSSVEGDCTRWLKYIVYSFLWSFLDFVKKYNKGVCLTVFIFHCGFGIASAFCMSGAIIEIVACSKLSVLNFHYKFQGSDSII